MREYSAYRSEMAGMRANGATYTAIASKYGCSRQNVHSLINREAVPRKPYRVHVKTVYPNLHDWLYANSINVQRFADMIGASYFVCRRMLLGETPFTTAQIRAVLEMTGMDFNEVFSEATPDAE